MRVRAAGGQVVRRRVSTLSRRAHRERTSVQAAARRGPRDPPGRFKLKYLPLK